MILLKEFKSFALKGNVIDLVTAVIIGGAFGKIVSSIVNDILLPPIGLLIGRVDFKDLKLVLQHAKPAIMEGSKIIEPAAAEVAMRYGNFLQNAFDFTIVAFCVFLVVKLYQRATVNDVVAEEAKPHEASNEEKLLIEIRDLLKQQQ